MCSAALSGAAALRGDECAAREGGDDAEPTDCGWDRISGGGEKSERARGAESGLEMACWDRGAESGWENGAIRGREAVCCGKDAERGWGNGAI